jgi:hypothetical protein
MNGPVFPEPDFYVPSGTGGGGKGKMIIAGLLIVIFLAIIAYMMWPSSSSASPPPSPPPNESPPPTWKPYCTFKATGTNKDNFNVASDSGIELFPIDSAVSEYKQDFDYDGSGNILTCKVNASTNSPEYAPSGPTALGYTFPTIAHPEKLVPEDGIPTKTDSVCTWNPKSNICDTPICSLHESYNNVLLSDLDKEQGIKQYLSQDELNTFIDGLSCPGGYKYGQCSGAPTQCSISGKQNNKINCLGNCSGDTNIYTKEECENANKKWIYEPENSQCKYESLDKPIFKADSIQKDSNGNYKMCDNPGDSVNLDSMIDTCSNTCYPNPINEHPANRNEMPLSWTNKCGFTDITNKIFNTNTSHITPCANSAVLKGNVYYNICSSDQNCSDVKSDIENHVSSVSSVSPPCQGGGDIFDVYNNCSAASCDNIFGRKATTGSTFAKCPNNMTPITPSPGKKSAISLPPASDCDPDSSSPFSIKDYFSKTAVGNCCANKTCDDEYPNNCPAGFSKRSPSPSPGSSGNPLSFQDCCVLETCSEYVTEKNPCVEGTTPTAGSDNTYYVLPTCCNGYIQITITLKKNKNITSLMQISTQNDNTLTNVFPSYILKQLLTSSKKLTLDSINPDKITKTADNLYFINNQTTFMDPLPTDKQTMDNALIQTQQNQSSEITGMKTNNQYKFYILTSQKYDSKSNSVTSFNISKAYTTVKNITDKISDSGPNISKINTINTILTNCMSTKGACDIIESSSANQVLNGDNSYCCIKSTCGNMLPPDKVSILSGKSPAGSGFKACGGGTYFDKDAPWTPSSPISYINASNQCCVSGNITAVNPPGTIAEKDTIGSKFGSYVKNTTTKEIPLSASIEFQWVDGKFKPKDPNMNKKLATNYTCAFNNASTPEYGVSKHSNGKYYYKLTGCEDGDNTFCKIPNSHKQGDSDSDTYDGSIYDLTGLMESNEGSYISMYATAQGGSESKHEGDIMANYGGIVCTSDPYGTVNLEPCDEPYDYIKFSGCNTYFSEVGGYEFYTRPANPEDCLSFTTKASCTNKEYENLCIWEENTCSPRPFPTWGQQVGENCGDKLNADDNYSDAFWLTEGFQNYKYKYGDKSLFKKGDSTRVITPSPSPGSSGPPASSREISRRTNYCGYKPKSQKKGDTDQLKSRVVDSTWMCKDKTCKEDNNLNIKLKYDPQLTSFTSYVNGDPLIYQWGVNDNAVFNKTFYDGKYNIVNGSFTVNDYRPLQGLPLTTFNLTDQYACVNKKSPSSPCARPTASPGDKPVCDPSCTLTPISDINDLNSGDNVKDRINKFTNIQNIGGVDYNASQMEYVHNNIKYHNNYATMCGDNKYLRFFDDYQKCTPCRYQRDPYPSPPNTYNEFYTTELNKLNSDEQSYINQHVYPKSSDASKPVFLSGVIIPSPNPSPGGNQNIILNETSPNKGDKNKMSNCSVNTSSTKRTKIPIGEYSTHFVPWWSESSATDLKITDTEFTTLSNQLSPGSPPINIPTCDLHKDRCEDKTTEGECNVNSSHSWTSPSSQHFNMCNWSGGKCVTNPDWMNDQTMCGHPCLSRMDAKPRECKFSDDCEIRDRYNIGAFSGTVNPKVTMYCDSDGRNPILYGNSSSSPINNDNTITANHPSYCNEGYYLIDVGDFVNTEGSNKSVYKCLSCNELNSYLVDSDSSGNTGASPMVKAFETYINACGTASQRMQYKSSGEWKEGSDGKCSKGTGNCTAFLWPSTAKSADPAVSLLTETDPTTKDKYTSAPVLYTQDPIVANQYVKSQIGNNYSDCQNSRLNNGNINMNSADCKTYVSAMEKILGLKTREYDTDHKFKGYNASNTIRDIGINFGNCDYNTEPIMAKWGTDSTSQKIPVNPGGMVAASSYNKGTTDLDKLILAGHLCPQREYLAEGRPTEAPKELISMNDRYWPATSKHTNPVTEKIEEYTYCKPLLGLGEECNSREEGKTSCAPLGVASKGDNNSLSKFTPGYCGKKYSGGGELKDSGPYYCLGALRGGSPCDSKSEEEGEDSQCSDWQQGWFADGTPKIYGADCSHEMPYTQRYCRGSGPILNNEPK